MGDIEGFDLSLFNRHVKRGILSRDYEPGFMLRNAPANLLTFDFSAALPLEGRASTALSSLGGTVTGIAQWIHIDLGGGATHENPPGTNREGHWRPGYYPCAASHETAAGEVVHVHGWHGEDSIAIGTDS